MLPIDQMYIIYQKWCEKLKPDKPIVCEAAEPQRTFHFIGNASVTGTAGSASLSEVSGNVTSPSPSPEI